jgi:hypothetical protein
MRYAGQVKEEGIMNRRSFFKALGGIALACMVPGGIAFQRSDEIEIHLIGADQFRPGDLLHNAETGEVYEVVRTSYTQCTIRPYNEGQRC